jgi:GNAT superfamily N-acetyltransferase
MLMVERTLRCAVVVRFESTSLSSPDARLLERACSEDIRTRYGGGEPEEPLDAGPFEPPAGAFVVAYLEVDGGDVLPVAGGGIRPVPGVDATCELKRMYVAPEARGRGIARALLERLEEEAVDLGYTTLWLETGTEQPEAMALYESHGYEPIAGFGRYKDEPKSRSFGRSLTP